jgi:hypothetical protein
MAGDQARAAAEVGKTGEAQTAARDAFHQAGDRRSAKG